MRSIMRTTTRRAAVAVGALALAAGAAGCGALTGGDEPETETTAEEDAGTEEDAATEEDATTEDDAATEEDATEEDAATEDDATEEDAAAESGPLSDEDLTAAADRFYEFLEKAAASDFVGACGLMIDPTTDEPVSGATAEGCAEGLETGLGENVSALGSIDRSSVETTDNGDGTAAVQFMGSDFGYNMVKASDGQWYIDSGV